MSEDLKKKIKSILYRYDSILNDKINETDRSSDPRSDFYGRKLERDKKELWELLKEIDNDTPSKI